MQASLVPQGAAALGQASLLGAALLHLGASSLLFMPWPRDAGEVEIYPVDLIFAERPVEQPATDQIASLVESLESDAGAIAETSDDAELEAEPAPPLEVPPAKPVRRVDLPELVPAAPLSPQAQFAREQGYLAQVARRLEDVKRYSSALVGRTSGGTAKVGFVVDAEGQVQASWLIASSGNALLDREALALLQRASPFDPLPLDLGKEQLVVRQDIRFGNP